MRETCDRAFKEWAVVCRALAEGRQSVILRKGGIAEGPGGFEVADSEFLLFPTYLHQSPAGWREPFVAEPEPAELVLTHAAAVTEWKRLETLEELRALRDRHLWSDAIVEERFRRWSEGGVHALFVQVYALPAPVRLPMLPAYSGCLSWITLDRKVSLAGATPVLSAAR